ncbi:sulfite exporter TauE/SafE family protein [Cohnella nanjingensis]|uniref:Sulfite exporter TauE/SafE family protein n=1 Tax=Cohnella nanjingensis TaxID=1387779 RepID=A0A7X0VG32_9BACL|nr:sulfite exporter TauE/SafE family protein [Cohnella nanjingensis]MBB6672700.1 sulfite exporter TauE/SafE family protein [Cohnella nanjingensis]
MAITPDTLLLAALSGLAGAPHCIIMCGGIVTSFAMNAQSSPMKPVLAYNAGRVITYSLIGAFMGGAGSFLNYAGSLVGLQGIASLLGGLLILLWTLNKFTLPTHRYSPLRIRFVADRLAAMRSRHELATVFVTGILLGFLPCGLTYAMQINAAASGSSLSGFLMMLVFGLCTLPALVLTGLFASKIRKAWRRRLRTAGVALALLMGTLSIMKGLSANGIVPPIHPWIW